MPPPSFSSCWLLSCCLIYLLVYLFILLVLIIYPLLHKTPGGKALRQSSSLPFFLPPFLPFLKYWNHTGSFLIFWHFSCAPGFLKDFITGSEMTSASSFNILGCNPQSPRGRNLFKATKDSLTQFLIHIHLHFSFALHNAAPDRLDCSLFCENTGAS